MRDSSATGSFRGRALIIAWWIQLQVAFRTNGYRARLPVGSDELSVNVGAMSGGGGVNRERKIGTCVVIACGSLDTRGHSDIHTHTEDRASGTAPRIVRPRLVLSVSVSRQRCRGWRPRHQIVYYVCCLCVTFWPRVGELRSPATRLCAYICTSILVLCRYVTCRERYRYNATTEHVPIDIPFHRLYIHASILLLLETEDRERETDMPSISRREGW